MRFSLLTLLSKMKKLIDTDKKIKRSFNRFAMCSVHGWKNVKNVHCAMQPGPGGEDPILEIEKLIFRLTNWLGKS